MMNWVMKMIKRRIEKLEQMQKTRNRDQSFYVAFAWDNQMRIKKGIEVAFEGSVKQGEEFLQELSGEVLAIRFNISRPPLKLPPNLGNNSHFCGGK